MSDYEWGTYRIDESKNLLQNIERAMRNYELVYHKKVVAVSIPLSRQAEALVMRFDGTHIEFHEGHDHELYFAHKETEIRPSVNNTDRIAALESERDSLRAALQEIVEIGATWREQLPGADEFFVGMFAIGRMRGVAEKALGIPLEDDTHE